MTYTIYITNKCTPDQRERIKKFFGIKGITVNGEAKVTITDKAIEQVLKRTALKGFIQIRYK